MTAPADELSRLAEAQLARVALVKARNRAAVTHHGAVAAAAADLRAAAASWTAAAGEAATCAGTLRRHEAAAAAVATATAAESLMPLPPLPPPAQQQQQRPLPSVVAAESFSSAAAPQASRALLAAGVTADAIAAATPYAAARSPLLAVQAYRLLLQGGGGGEPPSPVSAEVGSIAHRLLRGRGADAALPARRAGPAAATPVLDAAFPGLHRREGILAAYAWISHVRSVLASAAAAATADSAGDGDEQLAEAQDVDASGMQVEDGAAGDGGPAVGSPADVLARLERLRSSVVHLPPQPLATVICDTWPDMERVADVVRGATAASGTLGGAGADPHASPRPAAAPALSALAPTHALLLAPPPAAAVDGALRLLLRCLPAAGAGGMPATLSAPPLPAGGRSDFAARAVVAVALQVLLPPGSQRLLLQRVAASTASPHAIIPLPCEWRWPRGAAAASAPVADAGLELSPQWVNGMLTKLRSRRRTFVAPVPSAAPPAAGPAVAGHKRRRPGAAADAGSAHMPAVDAGDGSDIWLLPQHVHDGDGGDGASMPMAEGLTRPTAALATAAPAVVEAPAITAVPPSVPDPRAQRISQRLLGALRWLRRQGVGAVGGTVGTPAESEAAADDASGAVATLDAERATPPLPLLPGSHHAPPPDLAPVEAVAAVATPAPAPVIREDWRHQQQLTELLQAVMRSGPADHAPAVAVTPPVHELVAWAVLYDALTACSGCPVVSPSSRDPAAALPQPGRESVADVSAWLAGAAGTGVAFGTPGSDALAAAAVAAATGGSMLDVAASDAAVTRAPPPATALKSEALPVATAVASALERVRAVSAVAGAASPPWLDVAAASLLCLHSARQQAASVALPPRHRSDTAAGADVDGLAGVWQAAVTEPSQRPALIATIARLCQRAVAAAPVDDMLRQVVVQVLVAVDAPLALALRACDGGVTARLALAEGAPLTPAASHACVRWLHARLALVRGGCSDGAAAAWSTCAAAVGLAGGGAALLPRLHRDAGAHLWRVALAVAVSGDVPSAAGDYGAASEALAGPLLRTMCDRAAASRPVLVRLAAAMGSWLHRTCVGAGGMVISASLAIDSAVAAWLHLRQALEGSCLPGDVLASAQLWASCQASRPSLVSGVHLPPLGRSHAHAARPRLLLPVTAAAVAAVERGAADYTPERVLAALHTFASVVGPGAGTATPAWMVMEDARTACAVLASVTIAAVSHGALPHACARAAFTFACLLSRSAAAGRGGGAARQGARRERVRGEDIDAGGGDGAIDAGGRSDSDDAREDDARGGAAEPTPAAPPAKRARGTTGAASASSGDSWLYGYTDAPVAWCSDRVMALCSRDGDAVVRDAMDCAIAPSHLRATVDDGLMQIAAAVTTACAGGGVHPPELIVSACDAVSLLVVAATCPPSRRAAAAAADGNPGSEGQPHMWRRRPWSNLRRSLVACARACGNAAGASTSSVLLPVAVHCLACAGIVRVVDAVIPLHGGGGGGGGGEAAWRHALARMSQWIPVSSKLRDLAHAVTAAACAGSARHGSSSMPVAIDSQKALDGCLRELADLTAAPATLRLPSGASLPPADMMDALVPLRVMLATQVSVAVAESGMGRRLASTAADGALHQPAAVVQRLSHMLRALGPDAALACHATAAPLHPIAAAAADERVATEPGLPVYAAVVPRPLRRAPSAVADTPVHATAAGDLVAATAWLSGAIALGVDSAAGAGSTVAGSPCALCGGESPAPGRCRRCAEDAAVAADRLAAATGSYLAFYSACLERRAPLAAAGSAGLALPLSPTTLLRALASPAALSASMPLPTTLLLPRTWLSAPLAWSPGAAATAAAAMGASVLDGAASRFLRSSECVTAAVEAALRCDAGDAPTRGPPAAGELRWSGGTSEAPTVRYDALLTVLLVAEAVARGGDRQRLTVALERIVAAISAEAASRVPATASAPTHHSAVLESSTSTQVREAGRSPTQRALAALARLAGWRS